MEDGSVNHTGDPTVHTELLYRSDAVELTGLNNEGGGGDIFNAEKMLFPATCKSFISISGLF